MGSQSAMAVSRFDSSALVVSDFAHCRQIAEDIVALAGACGFDDHEQFAIALAVDEAIANAIEHGNQSDSSKKVQIEYSVDVQEVRVRITDEGPGFDPDSVPDPRLPENLDFPTGRGLLLMRESMSGIQFNSTGNQVELWKRKSA